MLKSTVALFIFITKRSARNVLSDIFNDMTRLRHVNNGRSSYSV